MRVKLKDITKFSKGTQINGKNLIDDGAYSYLNGGIKPSGKWNEFNVAENTVTISEGGNSSGYVNYMNEAFWCGAHCYYLYDGPKNSKYLYYALKSQQERLFRIRSGACMPNIKKSDLGNFIIEYEEDETRQEEVVKVLEKCELLIEDYNKKLVLLDEAVRARFVEMFGDPVTNDMLWNTDVLKDICTKIGSGSTPRGGKESYIDEGISLIRSMNVHNAYFEYKDLAHITLDQAEKLNNVVVEHDDLLFNITGASVARCCVVPSDVLPARVNQHVCILRCREKINPIFLQGLLVNENYQGKLLQIAKSGATREAINKQQLESLEIMIPPLELQNQFASFVKEIDKSRLLSNHSLFLIKSIIF